MLYFMLLFRRGCDYVKIIKEIVFDSQHITAVKLENGVTVYADDDGVGIGSDGKRYVRVSQEMDTVSMPSDTPWFFDDPNPVPIHEITPVEIGWTPDADAPIILKNDNIG